jgi:hypothetical protein
LGEIFQAVCFIQLFKVRRRGVCTDRGARATYLRHPDLLEAARSIKWLPGAGSLGYRQDGQTIGSALASQGLIEKPTGRSARAQTSDSHSVAQSAAFRIGIEIRSRSEDHDLYAL